MKKISILFLLSFTILFANASSINKVSKKVSKPTLEKKVFKQWMVTVTCNGQVHTACCFSTQQAALNAGDVLIALLCIE
jgi:hypothetical protein